MKNSHSFSKSLVMALPTAVLVALLVAAPPETMPGIEPQPFHTGAVGVIAGDVVQLNASNISFERAMSVQMQILNAAGAVLATSRLSLGPGQSRSLLMKAAGAGRRSIRGVVSAVCTVGTRPPDDSLIAATMEVFDSRTMVTKLVLTR